MSIRQIQMEEDKKCIESLNKVALFTPSNQQTRYVESKIQKLVVTVCAECHRACCIAGVFYCDEHRTAGLIDLPVSTLKRKALENPSYWKNAVLSYNYSIEVPPKKTRK